jgi:TRAP-type C4-dicarboxylate transport system substrate-binding protein
VAGGTLRGSLSVSQAGGGAPRVALQLQADKLSMDAVLKASAAAEQRGWAASRREADETRERLVKEGVIIVKPDEAFRGELSKLGVTLATDWEKRAGAEGAGVLKAYRQ